MYGRMVVHHTAVPQGAWTTRLIGSRFVSSKGIGMPLALTAREFIDHKTSMVMLVL